MDEAEAGSPEFWADKSPDAVAVIDGDEKLTYRDWNDRANRVADALYDLGLRKGDLIGMRFRLGFAWFIVQRALQKLGAGQVAVNYKLTPDEALYILKDSGAKGLACDDEDASRWTELDCGTLITVGQPAESKSHRLEDLESNGKPTARFGPVRPKIILYTSGTTGRPRGVPPVDPGAVDIPRLLKYMASVGGSPPTLPNATVFMTLPVHHGAGVAAATSAAARGGTAVLLDRFDPERALQLIDRWKIQHWIAVPTMLLRVQGLTEDTIQQYDLSSLVSLSTGAAPVPQSLKVWLIELLGDDVLWEAYGCSEAGMISFSAPEHQLTKPGSSGLPFEGVEINIVDEDWTRLPAGTTGEIAVNTPTVLKNYLGRGALGEDTVKDGFYRTGDVGHLDEDGFLFITDRVKDMIVAGGVNIYPAEIEEAIVGHPDVEDCAVIGIPQDDFGEQVLAFVVARAGRPVTSDSILSFLEDKLAGFKRPRVFEFVESLPLSPMGKVLKTELRAPYWKDRERSV